MNQGDWRRLVRTSNEDHWRRVRGMGRVIALSLTTMIVGCLPTFEYPVSDDGETVDTSPYEGAWISRSVVGDKRVAGDLPATVTRVGVNRLRASSLVEGQEMGFEIKLARVGGDIFASYKAEGGQADWRIVRLALGEDARRLSLKTVRVANVKTAIAQGQLAAVVLAENSSDESVWVTSEGTILRTFIAANAAAFDGEVLVMTRATAP